MRLLRILALVAFCLAFMPSPAVAVTGFDSAYSGESAFVTLNPGDTASFQVFFMNTGTVAWTKASDTQVDLAACLSDKVTCNAQDPSDAAWNNGWISTTRYATHTQTIVSTGSIATFSYSIKAPSNATGTTRFNGDLVVAKTGDRIHPQGYYQDATINATGSITQPTPTPTPQPIVPPVIIVVTPTPTPTPLGMLRVNQGLTASGCPGGFNTVFTGSGLAGDTGYQLTATRTAPTPAASFSLAAFTTEDDGTFAVSVTTNTAIAPSTYTVVATLNGTAKTNTVQVTFVCDADLAVTKMDSPDPVLAGFDLTYTITVANNGPDTAQQVSLRDTIPANTTFVSFSAPDGWQTQTPATADTNTVTARRPTLDADNEGSTTFTLVVRVNESTPAGTVITNTATVQSATPDSNATNNSATTTTTVNVQTLLCFDGTTDTAAGQTGGVTYGGLCTKTGDRSATLDNAPVVLAGSYSGVYFDPSSLSGDPIGTVTTLRFNFTGSDLQGNGPRFSVPINTAGTGGTTDFYIFIDARDCNDGAGLVDAIHDATCTIYWTSGPVSGVANWAALVALNPTWKVSNSLPFIIADGTGAWNLSNVRMGN